MRQDLIQTRLKKIERLRELGVDPYPYGYRRTHTTDELLADFEARIGGDPVAICGRLMAIRPMGKASFAHLQDPGGRIQLYLRKDEVGERAFEVFGLLDLGDLVGVRGVPMRTRTGEASIQVSELTVLAKAVAPLPVVKEKDGHVFDAWEDQEARARRRHLDLLLHPEARRTFEVRARTIGALRRFLDNLGFLEVETPVLQSIYGGAMARPFVTWHNALGMKLYLRIAEELPLKKLLVGGMERVYELGRVFRNEGVDRSHNPEFTLLEFYWAWADYLEAMDLVEEMLRAVAREAVGSLRVSWREEEIDLESPFARRSMVELIRSASGIDVLTAAEETLRTRLEGQGIDVPPYAGRGHMIEALFDAEVQPGLIQPTFVTDHPREISPLAKAHRSHPDLLVERFELFIGGQEFANAFSELNDPIDQRARFEDQARRRDLGDEEAQVLDEEFLEALEHGMPPAAGVGLGVDRLAALLSGASSLRDVLLFPAMRPEDGRPQERGDEESPPSPASPGERDRNPADQSGITSDRMPPREEEAGGGL